MSNKRFRIGKRWVGDGEPVFIVAELSCNHMQRKDIAVKLIEEAAASEADAVKFQTFRPDTVTLNCHKSPFVLESTLWKGKSLYELYSETYMPWEWFGELIDIAKSSGLEWFSMVSGKEAVDFMKEFDMPAYKIASFEITHIPLIDYVSKIGKPIILSTGVASISDIELAIDTIRGNGLNDYALLKCTSAYPAPFSEMNLRVISNLAETFDAVVGLSDHSLGTVAPLVAVSLGAKIVEKHFILDRNMKTHDSPFSITPSELKELVTAVRNAEDALGEVDYKLGSETKKHHVFTRSIYVARDIRKGETFTENNIKVVRPSGGLHPKYYDELIGKTARRDLKKGDPLKWTDIE